MTEPAAARSCLIRWAEAFSVDGGAPIVGDSGSLSLTGVNSITVNLDGGDDSFFVAPLLSQCRDLTVNGGTGDDTVQMGGNINFAANAESRSRSAGRRRHAGKRIR